MNKIIKSETIKPDVIATTVKIIFGTFLLVRTIKTATEIYFKIEDRKNYKKKGHIF